MDNNDFSNLGKQIQDTVQHAVDSMDFEQLNRTINDTVSQALHEAKIHKERIQKQYEQNRANQQYRQQYRQATPNYQPDYTKQKHGASDYASPKQQMNYAGQNAVRTLSKKQQLSLVLAPKVKKGTWKIVVGGIFILPSIGDMIECLLQFPLLIAVNGFSASLGELTAYGLFTVLSAWLLTTGIRQRIRYGHAKNYAEILNGRGFCTIQELAKETGKTEVYVRRNIRSLIQKKMFREAYMDKQGTCLMVNKEAYNYYLQAEESRSEREAAEEKQREAEGKLSPEIVEMIHKGDGYIRTIREANDDIPGEVISAKLDQLETVVRRIFDSVKKHPEQKKEMDKFMDYYMPTTLKLVNAYREFDALEIKGTNIQNAMNEIENTLDTIIAAFKKLLDDLFQDAAFDVAADISVLHTMLAREGYKETDFK